MKKCGICKRLKEESYFSKNGIYLASYCKKCNSKHAVDWAKKNPEKNREKALNWFRKSKINNKV